MNKKSCTDYGQTFSDVPPNVIPPCGGTKPYPLIVYFDGECPMCRRESDFMNIFNRKKHLEFIDFAASSYHPAEHRLSPCDLGQVIHARWADGTLITGVEVFREMWEAIGLRSLARLTRRPTINKLLVRAYDLVCQKPVTPDRFPRTDCNNIHVVGSCRDRVSPASFLTPGWSQ